jgi:hypothetical protein
MHRAEGAQFFKREPSGSNVADPFAPILVEAAPQQRANRRHDGGRQAVQSGSRANTRRASR